MVVRFGEMSQSVKFTEWHLKRANTYFRGLLTFLAKEEQVNHEHVFLVRIYANQFQKRLFTRTCYGNLSEDYARYFFNSSKQPYLK